MTSFEATVNEKKIVALHKEPLQKTYLCPSCKSSMVLDEDDTVECSCEEIASVDAATPNANVEVTILDEHKFRIDLQVKLEQLNAYYNMTNDLAKQMRASSQNLKQR